MRRLLSILTAIGFMLPIATPAESACCYFAAKDKDIEQPSQKAFLTWDPVEKVESFTVQPRFEGNADDFGMVIPTPSKPKIDDMPRDFFRHLAVFTILEPIDVGSSKQGGKGGGSGKDGKSPEGGGVKIVEVGIVGNLEFKVIVAEKADGLYEWLKDNRYNYGGDEATLDFYVKKQWYFTVMKIDSMQMKKKRDGSFDGEITPTRFTFASERLIYPLKITQISVRGTTEALFYVQAPYKMDLPEWCSYQHNWSSMYCRGMRMNKPNNWTKAEKAWIEHLEEHLGDLEDRVRVGRDRGRVPSSLEWAKRITEKDLALLDGKEEFKRDAPKEEVEKLKNLKGFLRKDQFVTKIRKVFGKAEMTDDLTFVRAKVGGKEDNVEYYSFLRSSPP